MSGQQKVVQLYVKFNTFIILQVQVRGTKTWYLKPPPECWSACHGIMQVLYLGSIVSYSMVPHSMVPQSM